MSALETYLKAVAENKGVWRIASIRNLRLYMKQTPEEDLLIAIRNIKDPELLRHLLSAGLRAELQRAVTAQYDTLTGRPVGGE